MDRVDPSDSQLHGLVLQQLGEHGRRQPAANGLRRISIRWHLRDGIHEGGVQGAGNRHQRAAGADEPGGERRVQLRRRGFPDARDFPQFVQLRIDDVVLRALLRLRRLPEVPARRLPNVCRSRARQLLVAVQQVQVERQGVQLLRLLPTDPHHARHLLPPQQHSDGAEGRQAVAGHVGGDAAGKWKFGADADEIFGALRAQRGGHPAHAADNPDVPADPRGIRRLPAAIHPGHRQR